LWFGRFLLGVTMDYTKTCKTCQEQFPATIEYFNKHKGGKYGLMAKCRSCYKIYNQKIYQKHQEKRVAEKRIYRRENRDKVLESNKKSYKKYRDKRCIEKQIELRLYPEKIKQRRKQQYLKHRDKRLKAVKKYQEKNKDKIRQRVAKHNLERYHTDINFKLKMNLSRRIRQFICKNGQNTIELIGCSIDELKQHLQSLFQKDMNWKNYGKNGWHIDHILPCASFDLTDLTQRKKCFHYSNLQPLWAADNIRKSDKVPYIF
jgi:hypothetical protein